MIRWRSQQSIQEQGLLIEYLAVRISMELAIAKPYLPLKIKRLRKSFDRPTYSFLDHWGIFQHGMVTNVCTEQSELLAFAYRFDENIRRKLWLEAWEQTHAEQLREKIASKQRATNDKSVY